MKKIGFIVSLLAVFICTSAVAEVVTTRRAVPQKPKEQAKTVSNTAVSSKLANNIMTCTPYTEMLNSAFLGFPFNFAIKINGWQKDKCEVVFTANVTIKETYQTTEGPYDNVVDSRDEAFAKCSFTKQQLERVGDSILQEEARKNGAKMLKDPDEIDLSEFSNMSENDEALMDIIFRQGACSLSTGNNQSINLKGFGLFGF